MRGCGRAVSGAFRSFLFRAPDAKEVRYLGLRLATSPWLNIRRRFAAGTSLRVDRSRRPRSGRWPS
jgi:hypothetical protein